MRNIFQCTLIFFSFKHDLEIVQGGDRRKVKCNVYSLTLWYILNIIYPLE